MRLQEQLPPSSNFLAQVQNSTRNVHEFLQRYGPDGAAGRAAHAAQLQQHQQQSGQQQLPRFDTGRSAADALAGTSFLVFGALDEDDAGGRGRGTDVTPTTPPSSTAGFASAAPATASAADADAAVPGTGGFLLPPPVPSNADDDDAAAAAAVAAANDDDAAITRRVVSDATGEQQQQQPYQAEVSFGGGGRANIARAAFDTDPRTEPYAYAPGGSRDRETPTPTASSPSYRGGLGASTEGRGEAAAAASEPFVLRSPARDPEPEPTTRHEPVRAADDEPPSKVDGGAAATPVAMLAVLVDDAAAEDAACAGNLQGRGRSGGTLPVANGLAALIAQTSHGGGGGVAASVTEDAAALQDVLRMLDGNLVMTETIIPVPLHALEVEAALDVDAALRAAAAYNVVLQEDEAADRVRALLAALEMPASASNACAATALPAVAAATAEFNTFVNDTADALRELQALIHDLAKKDAAPRIADMLKDIVTAQRQSAASLEGFSKHVSTTLARKVQTYSLFRQGQQRALREAVAQTEAKADTLHDELQKERAAQSAKDRAGLNSLVRAWALIAKKYSDVLSRARASISDMHLTDPSVVVSIDAVADLLQQSVQDAAASTNPDDAASFLQTLHHAIHTSAETIRALIARTEESARAEPAFNPVQHAAVERELVSIRNSIRDLDTEVQTAQSTVAALGGGGSSGGSGEAHRDVESMIAAARTSAAAAQALASKTAALDAARKLEADLAAAHEVTSAAKTRADVAALVAQQARWLQVCDQVNGICHRAETRMRAARDGLGRKARIVRDDAADHVAALQQEYLARVSAAAERLVVDVRNEFRRYASAARAWAAGTSARINEAASSLTHAAGYYATVGATGRADVVGPLVGRAAAVLHDRLLPAQLGLATRAYPMILHASVGKAVSCGADSDGDGNGNGDRTTSSQEQ